VQVNVLVGGVAGELVDHAGPQPVGGLGRATRALCRATVRRVVGGVGALQMGVGQLCEAWNIVYVWSYLSTEPNNLHLFNYKIQVKDNCLRIVFVLMIF